MIISVDSEKVFDKIQHPFMTTILKVGSEEIYLNLIKAICEKPTANIKHSVEKLRAFLPKWGTRQGCPLSPCLSKIVLEVLATGISQEKEITKKKNKKEKEKEIAGIHIGKKRLNCHYLQTAWYYT